ncbi:MAG: L,D-transpeptidase family protein [Streptosporangiales bacterium]|nr:L,D-transpeptidase family protein [Streptosporangiales bacterium]
MPVLRRGAALLTALICGVVMIAGCGTASSQRRSESGAVTMPSPGPVPSYGGLPQATTFARLPAAPRDAEPAAPGGGTVLHPNTPATVHAAPGGRAIAVLPATQLGGPAWVPVVRRSGAWSQVLLPSRPNHSTGWVRTGHARTPAFDERRNPYTVRVDIGSRTLAISHGGHVTATWPVAVGAARTPTPLGRTFLLALLAPKTGPSPLVLPLGAHSPTLEHYGKGPATIALHGWHDPSVFRRAVSHGCVRVPDAALRQLARLPLGTLVLITP